MRDLTKGRTEPSGTICNGRKGGSEEGEARQSQKKKIKKKRQWQSVAEKSL